MSAHHLLLIEDDDAEARLAKRTLQKISPDTEVTRFGNGIEFIDYLESAPTEQVDLVLMDLHMPVMGGLDLLDRLQNQGTRLPFPLVVFSSSQDPAEIRQAYELGISAFVTKPDEPSRYRQSLKDIVAFWLRTNRLS